MEANPYLDGRVDCRRRSRHLTFGFVLHCHYRYLSDSFTETGFFWAILLSGRGKAQIADISTFLVATINE